MREFHHINLCQRNSFGVDQRAECLVEFQSEDELQQFFRSRKPAVWMVLSGGNNILFTRDYAGTLLTPTDESVEILADDGEHVGIKVGAGMEWDDLVAWAVDRDLWGIENLSKIPGKAGAAPVQNIGAYGAEAAHVIREVRVYLTEEDRFANIPAEECRFGYRESIFKHSLKGKAVICSILIELHRTPTPHTDYGDVHREVEARGGATLRNIRDAICEIRRFKLPDPKLTGNAGSFFKNPIVPTERAEELKREFPDMPTYPTPVAGHTKLAAGWLIDRAGLKGYHEGRVGVHDRQALVLINLGGATGGEVIAFAHTIQQKVKARFGIEISTEVNII